METKSLDVFFKGREVLIVEGLSAYVYPCGIIHIQEQQRLIMSSMRVVMGMKWERDETGKIKADAIPTIMAALLPIMLDQGFELLCKCVKGFDLRDPLVPHWVLPQVATVWIEESFGSEKKIRPWVEMIESLVEKTTKQKISIWSIISKLSQDQDTLSTKFSTTKTQDGPMPDGQRDSSGESVKPADVLKAIREAVSSATS